MAAADGGTPSQLVPLRSPPPHRPKIDAIVDDYEDEDDDGKFCAAVADPADVLALCVVCSFDIGSDGV